MLTVVLILMTAFTLLPVQDGPPPGEIAPTQDVTVAGEAAAPPDTTATDAPAPLRVPDVTEDELVLGDINAPETIIVYSSLICPQCAAWHTEGLPQLIAGPVSTGYTRVVTRYVPLEELSAVAAAVVRCAVKENQMNVAGALFENHAALLAGTMTETDWQLAGVAASGRTREEIVTCLEDPATLQATRQALDAAVAAGVQGVPSFFVNGLLASSSLPVDGSGETQAEQPPSSPAT